MEPLQLSIHTKDPTIVVYRSLQEEFGVVRFGACDDESNRERKVPELLQKVPVVRTVAIIRTIPVCTRVVSLCPRESVPQPTFRVALT